MCCVLLARLSWTIAFIDVKLAFVEPTGGQTTHMVGFIESFKLFLTGPFLMDSRQNSHVKRHRVEDARVLNLAWRVPSVNPCFPRTGAIILTSPCFARFVSQASVCRKPSFPSGHS